ncbi:hypothetical protein QQ045_026230 [Rhodiola kirilowii]
MRLFFVFISLVMGLAGKADVFFSVESLMFSLMSDELRAGLCSAAAAGRRPNLKPNDSAETASKKLNTDMFMASKKGKEALEQEDYAVDG